MFHLSFSQHTNNPSVLVVLLTINSHFNNIIFISLDWYAMTVKWMQSTNLFPHSLASNIFHLFVFMVCTIPFPRELSEWRKWDGSIMCMQTIHMNPYIIFVDKLCEINYHNNRRQEKKRTNKYLVDVFILSKYSRNFLFAILSFISINSLKFILYAVILSADKTLQLFVLFEFGFWQQLIILVPKTSNIISKSENQLLPFIIHSAIGWLFCFIKT